MPADLSALLRSAAIRLDKGPAAWAPLLALCAEAQVVLIGEASHGTHEFYAQRAALTQHLIAELGFNAVAAEADWPDAQRINRYVRGAGGDSSASAALADFKRFPAWMWRNTAMAVFVDWLRQFNTSQTALAQVGFYGLDLHSLTRSMQAVVEYLAAVDPAAAARARQRYAYFDQFAADPLEYARATRFNLIPSGESAVVEQLRDLRAQVRNPLYRDGFIAEDTLFEAEQNAHLARNAERYYRTLFRGRGHAWNLRDQHMAATLEALRQHLSRDGGPAKIVVWAHNSHVGDARAAPMASRGGLNIGQLARERYGRQAVLIGLSTYSGTVSAASEWNAPVERMRVRPAQADSYEALLHTVDLPQFALLFNQPGPAVEALREPRLARAIGAIYRPDTERLSHYVQCCLPNQFDALLHSDYTRAVEPLERTALWEDGELPTGTVPPLNEPDGPAR